MKSNFSVYFSSLVLGVAVAGLLGVWYAFAQFTPPGADPPAGNVSPPLNVGPVGQNKQAGLNLGLGLTSSENGLRVVNGKLLVENGNVGIGTASPGAKLEVNAKTGSSNIFMNTDQSDVFNSLQFNEAGTSKWGFSYDQTNDHYYIYDFTRSGKVFRIGDNGSMSLMESGGNVGIGTVSPIVTLDVNGQVRIRGGSPLAGRVLTSAADGTATWQDPAAVVETDPEVGDVATSGQWCRADGSAVQCDQPDPTTTPTPTPTGVYGWCQLKHSKTTACSARSPAFCLEPVPFIWTCNCPAGYTLARTGSDATSWGNQEYSYHNCVKN